MDPTRQQIDDLHKKVARLAEAAEAAKKNAEKTGKTVKKLDTAVHDLEKKTDRSIADLQHQLRSLETVVGRLRAELRETATRQDYLRGRLTILDRWRNKLNGTEVALLHLDPHLVALGKTVREADSVVEQLLSPEDRMELEDLRTQASTRELRRKLHENDLVKACDALATTPHDSPDHARARHAYQQAKGALLGVMHELASGARRVAQAEAELQRDDDHRHLHADRLRAADEASAQIRAAARDMITEVGTLGVELPLWMFILLDRSGAKEGFPRWIDGAVDVLTYRAVYNFQSSTDALGHEPGSDWSRTRREWRDRLMAGRFNTGGHVADRNAR